MPEENYAESAELAMETIEEEARGERSGQRKWIPWASLSTMVMALFSAMGGLLAGKTANETIIERQKQISELIKLNRHRLAVEVMLTRAEVIKLRGKEAAPELLERITSANAALAKHAQEEKEDVEDSETSLFAHELFAIGTTILSVAITMTGMAVVVSRKPVWYSGLLFGVVGAGIIVLGFLRMG